MNKRQFISLLQKELNAIFGIDCEIEVCEGESGNIVVSFWRNGIQLGFYTLENVKYTEEYLQKHIGIVRQGKILQRKMMLDELKNILTANNEEAKE